MRERGGPTTQAGIYYQNSVAALYLGRMCDSAQRLDAHQVIQLRVEAPTNVDDTFVLFADRHTAYIQAKENISVGDEAWLKLWKDFAAQYQRDDFQKGKDRLRLHIGVVHQSHQFLQTACDWARTSASYQEWWERLGKRRRALIEKITLLLPPELLTEPNLLTFFSHLEVEIWPSSHIDRDLVPSWLPSSNISLLALFRILRDLIEENARVRGTFTASSLRAALSASGVSLVVPKEIGELQSAIKASSALLRQEKSTIGMIGRHIERSIVDDIVLWAQESTYKERVAMLLDQAGMGKTVVMHDVLKALERKGIATLAIKVDQQLSGLTKYSELSGTLHLPDAPERIVTQLATTEPVVVLIDQIDALSLSLARDQMALNIVLDLVAQLRFIPDVHILLSCRIFDRNSDPRLKQIDVGKEFPLTELSIAEIQPILEDVGIEHARLSTHVQKLLCTPLHLDLFVRAIEGQTFSPAYGDIQGIASLQDLYALLWRNVILKVELGGPSEFERVEVLRLITERMNREQQISVPHSVFTTSETAYLQSAVDWLASAGILVSGETKWSFLHQTFFDYCYARQFVESGGRLTEMVRQSDQGLFVRPQIIQILAYLRGSKHPTYLQELERILKINVHELRFHLRDLVLRWFGALPNPTADEWIVARRMLANPATRPRILHVVSSNPGWFSWLNGTSLQELLAKDDQILDTQVLPYIASIIEVDQRQVIEIIRPYLNRSEQWNNRIAQLLQRIHNWQSSEAIDLFTQIILLLPQFHLNNVYEVARIAAAYPATGCRLLRLTFDRILEQYQQRRSDPQAMYLSLAGELDSLGAGIFHEVIPAISQAEPNLFLSEILPWLEKVLQLTRSPSTQHPFYIADELSDGWYETTYIVQRVLIQSFIDALVAISRSHREAFHKIATNLADLPYQTTQQLLCRVYTMLVDKYATDGFEFIVADQRRLHLGDHEQFESRQLIKALYPLLSHHQRVKLEAAILSYVPIWKRLGVRGLRWRGLEQLYLLQSIPEQYLTERGRHALSEWERKFPETHASQTPIISRGGFVGSPIPENAAKRMSDNAWLHAIEKYHGDVTHTDFLKGGAHQLSGVLVGLVKEQPERFYGLINRVPDTVDVAYVGAFMNGLAESSAPAEWVFNVVRRFCHHPGPDIKRTISYALEKRVEDGFPSDICDLLEGFVHGTESLLLENDRNPFHGYLNSDRGSAFRTLMRALTNQGTPEAAQKKWELIEYVATDPSSTLRAGAISELLYLLRTDRSRSVALFEILMEGHPELLRAQFTQDFLYYGMYKYFSHVRPFIQALMEDDDDACKQRGAILACIAALSPMALETSQDLAVAQQMAENALTGQIQWRRGAAIVYTQNIKSSSSDICAQKLPQLLNDDDETVRGTISHMFRFLDSDHMYALREFMQVYAASRSAYTGMRDFTTYLWEHGLLEPLWTLSIVETILKNEYHSEATPWSLRGEELVRLILRIYTDPTSDAARRKRAMDVFDLLMERYTGEAQIVLGEWDRR